MPIMLTMPTKNSLQSEKSLQPEKSSQPTKSSQLERSSQIKKSANSYIAHGLSVIPLKPNSKDAATAWGVFQEQRPTPEEVANWWRSGSNFGLGIVCGRVSGIVVLDIDDEEKFGVALKAIGEKLPDTPTVRTRKGWHLYFRYPANRDVGRHKRLNDWGAELRGDGCYVVAPPTEIDGKRYHWAERNGRLMVLGKVPIAECPEWLLDAFGVPFADEQNEHTSALQSPLQSPPQATLQVPQPTNGKGYTLSDEQKRALKAIVVPLWVEGQRHELALGLAGLLAKLGVSQDEALALLREIATEAGDNEWKDRERALQDSFNKLWRGEQIVGYKRLEEIVGEETAKLIATILPPRKTEGETTSSKRQIRLLTLSEWDEQLAHLSQGSWFVEGLLRAGWLLVINARPKVGKSIVSVNLALALAEGKSFLNLPTSPCAVLYIDLERPLETLNRFKTLNAQDNPNIFVPEGRIGADMLETLQELIRQAKERANRDVVVFVDTLGDFIKPALRQRRASINDYDAIAEILQELRDLALKLGCAFVFVHHARKALSEEPTEVDVLGSTAIAGKFDVIAHLQPDKTESDTLSLIAEGNAIAKTILHFAINNDYRLEICEAPAKTKKEEAARFIVEELKRHPEGLPRCEIERRILERGIEKTQSGAHSLVGRVVDELRGHIVTEKVGRNAIYRLREQPTLPMSRSEQPPEGSTEGKGRLGSSVTYIEFEPNEPSRAMDDLVHLVHPSLTNDEPNEPNEPSRVTNVTQYGSLGSNTIGTTDEPCRVTDVTSDWQWDYIASDIPIPPKLISFGNLPEQVSHANPTKPCQYTKTDVSYPQSPEIPEPTYSTLRNEELIDTELLISELDEFCVELPAQQKQPTPSEQPILPEQPTLSEQTEPLEQAIQHKQSALSAQATQPNPSLPKPSLPDRSLPDRLACLCGSELRLFGKTYKCLRCDSPRPAVCRRCGKALKFIAENRAECIGCGALYVFDRNRRLWLCDEDAF
jgi:hypothetical protein